MLGVRVVDIGSSHSFMGLLIPFLSAHLKGRRAI